MKVEEQLQIALSSHDGDRLMKAYEAIYEEYHGLIAFVISKYVANPADAEEILNDAFLSFFNCKKKGEVRSIKYFLVVSAKNKCMDRLSRPSFDPLEIEPPFKDEYSSFLDSLKEALGEEDYELLYDYIVEESSSQELAARRGVSSASIRMRIARIKKKVRALFKEA